MATLSVPDETYQRLSERAAALEIGVDEFVRPTLERLASGVITGWEPRAPLDGDAWLSEFDAWKQDAIGRAHRYPPGFVADDSRDSIYGDREDTRF